MKVVVLVPRRAGDRRRDRVWEWLSNRWATECPDWPVTVGDHDHGPFNRSAALNNAAGDAGTFDVAVITDADSFVGTDQLHKAVRRSLKTGRMTLAYDQFRYLSRHGSRKVMASYDGSWEPFVEWTMYDTCSSMVVVPRALWETAGGFDERFAGWGFEDVGFSLACQTFAGGFERIRGSVWHLWHPVSPGPRSSGPNFELFQRYKAAFELPDPERAMRALLDERAVA